MPAVRVHPPVLRPSDVESKVERAVGLLARRQSAMVFAEGRLHYVVVEVLGLD